MTTPTQIQFSDVVLDDLAALKGLIAVFVTPDGKMDQGARKVNSLSRKALLRFVESDSFEGMKDGDVSALAYPAGLEATGVLVVKMPRRPDVALARRAGVQLAKAQGGVDLIVIAGGLGRVEEVALGVALRTYSFDIHKSADPKPVGAVTFMVSKGLRLKSLRKQSWKSLGWARFCVWAKALSVQARLLLCSGMAAVTKPRLLWSGRALCSIPAAFH